MSLINPTYDQLAQYAHFFSAFSAALLFGWYAIGVVVIYAVIKEFWFDLKYETPEVSGGFSGGMMDATFLILGAVCGELVKWGLLR